MTNLCINCSQITTNDSDFCNSCMDKMEAGVEMSVHSTNANIIDTKSHGLFQTRNVTGKILSDDEDLIANLHRNNDQGNYYFWMFILVIIFFMVLIAVIN
ncbi:MAG: hypothetical protein HeimC2_19160 [Candidatus Heimdallarchaeota archaeon LC_2]|nr:MAG: hypothetical protein HeimC2_19160 [Candidatus Heimdallarchaeota archaeon LC_2]